MNNLNLTIELCAEDRARLDAILTALQSVGTPFNPPAPVTSGPEQEQPAQDTQDGAETQHATHGMVQDLVITLASWGYKSEAREIVQRFAPRVSAIPDADLDAVYVALDAVRREHEGEN